MKSCEFPHPHTALSTRQQTVFCVTWYSNSDFYVLCVCRFWMAWYPEEFSHGSLLLRQLNTLQQAMASAEDTELLDLVSSDSL